MASTLPVPVPGSAPRNFQPKRRVAAVKLCAPVSGLAYFDSRQAVTAQAGWGMIWRFPKIGVPPNHAFE